MTDSELEKIKEISNKLGLINSMLLAEDGFSEEELTSLLGTVAKINLSAMGLLDELAPHASLSSRADYNADSLLKTLDEALTVAESMWVLFQVPKEEIDHHRLRKGTERIIDILDKIVPRPLPPRIKNDDNK